MVQFAYPDKKLLSYEMITGGCANFNIKITLTGNEQPLNLRIYLRDKEAAYRKARLSTLLKPTIPVPLTHYIGDYKEYRFALTEFMEGLSLRNLLLSHKPHDVGTIMHEVGALLAKITDHEFPKAGFFDKDLTIIEGVSQDSYLTFVKGCLQNQRIVSHLTADTVSKINYCLGKYGHLFPDGNEKQLIHADFDPANILVDKVNGAWQVSGILDWEFSFAGSVLWDVANMLRYTHQMPTIFEESFLQGLKSGGIYLPEGWRTTVHMLNLSSLLDCLVRGDPENRPNQWSDSCELVHHIMEELDKVIL